MVTNRRMNRLSKNHVNICLKIHMFEIHITKITEKLQLYRLKRNFQIKTFLHFIYKKSSQKTFKKIY